ncbi:MAG: cyclase family protein [Acidimicrobiales bacterium]
MQAEVPSGNWGRWGAEDERGALNLVTPEVVLDAARGLRTGKVYSLALPISRSRTPAVWDRPPPERFTRTAPQDLVEREGSGGQRVGSADDMLVLPSHAGTHIDALCHVFEGDSFYNGHPVDSFTTRRGAGKCSIVRTGTVATRGLLLDVPAASGLESLAAGHVIAAADLDACCESQGVEVLPGDAVLIRTGWLEMLAADASTPPFPQPGIGLEAAGWLADHDVCLVAADNSAVEVLPFDGGELAVHVRLIVHGGIALLEHAWLGEMAADRCHVCLLVVGALPVVGATGSPVNPIAIG